VLERYDCFIGIIAHFDLVESTVNLIEETVQSSERLCERPWLSQEALLEAQPKDQEDPDVAKEIGAVQEATQDEAKAVSASIEDVTGVVTKVVTMN
jgi:hypothetical protein